MQCHASSTALRSPFPHWGRHPIVDLRLFGFGGMLRPTSSCAMSKDCSRLSFTLFIKVFERGCGGRPFFKKASPHARFSFARFSAVVSPTFGVYNGFGLAVLRSPVGKLRGAKGARDKHRQKMPCLLTNCLLHRTIVSKDNFTFVSKDHFTSCLAGKGEHHART